MTPILRLGLDADDDELVVDMFAGGGGASHALTSGLGRPPDIAINHCAEALAMHELNHPTTRHIRSDVFEVNPEEVCEGRPVGFAWFSPDCTYHSKAKGGKPRDRKAASKSRALSSVVIVWARTVRPRVIMLENVEEFAGWGPLDADGRPIKAKKSLSFRIWLGKLRALGYHVEWRELCAHDYGAPTTRKRLFLIARRDGKPIVWPEPTHGPGLLPYRAAAECIDWSIPTPSIFLSRAEGRKLRVNRPLADKTLRRIARGVVKFVIGAAQPFVVPVTHGRLNDSAPHSVERPLRTITGAHREEIALVSPTLIQTGYGERTGQAPRCLDIEKPLGTIIAGGTNGCGNGKHALVAAFLAKHYDGGPTKATGSSLAAPVHTITTKDHHALVTARMARVGTERVTAFLTKFYGTSTGQSAQLPLAAITAGGWKHGLVYVHGEPFAISDIGMRMLHPRELFRAQGFPDDYRIDPLVPSKRKPSRLVPLSKTGQIRMCGNSVSPPPAEALIRANYPTEEARRVA